MTGAFIGNETIMTFTAQRRKESSKIVPLPLEGANEFLALTQGVMSGDDAAATDFFNRYCDRLFRYLLVVARGDEYAARESLSHAMIKATRHMKPMRSAEDIWRWLARLGWTSFIDHCRKNQRRIVTAPELEGSENAAAQDTELAAALNECLADLPLEEREIIERFYFEDQSQAALAAQANSTRKAVESKLARIRQKLRTAILKKLS
jgi:RNA polymerase sigma factor (sigma-70 family)